MDWNHQMLWARYEQLRTSAQDPDQWLDSQIGGDLWVDGLNVFLSIEPDDFAAALADFWHAHSDLATSVMSTLQALHRFCLDQAQKGEFELYQALAVGMTWLSLTPETNRQFFNVPVLITNHSTALLLSPTYQAVWAHSYNAGLELYVDLESDKAGSLFRPEHGRIYQRTSSYAKGTYVKYPFSGYFHEMLHILLFYDVYQRVLGTIEEERSYLTHLEGCISGWEERLAADLLSVGYDLNLIDDGFGDHAGHPEAGAFRIRVMQGQADGVTAQGLNAFTKRYMQLGEDHRYIPENPVKAQILQHHLLQEAEEALIWPHYREYMLTLQIHSIWGKKSGARNRLPAFQEVVELVPCDPYCWQKLQESLDPNSWPTVQALFSKEPWPELCAEKRRQHRQVWAWREWLSRLAEMRGSVSQLAEHESEVLTELLKIAEHTAAVIRADEPLHMPTEQHEKRIAALQEEINHTLLHLPAGEMRTSMLAMLEDPFTSVLEPS